MPLRKPPLLALAAFAAGPTLHADPSPGATREAVVAELGEPTGRLVVAEREELHYARGRVVMKNGTVVETDLLSEQEWKRRESLRLAGEKDRAENEALENAALAGRRKKGADALTLLVNDARWKESTGESRVETLERFIKAYPDTDIAAVKLEATRKRDLELAEKRRLKDLEARVTSAENRAQDAENRARVAENNARQAAADARHAEASAYLQRAQAQNSGLQYYTFAGGGLMNGRPYCNYPYGGSTVSVSHGGIVVTGGGAPPGVTPRPIVIVTPKPAPKPPGR